MKAKPFGSFKKVEPDTSIPFQEIDTGEKAVHAFKILRDEPYIAFDIETTGFNPRDANAEVVSIAFSSPEYLGAMLLDERSPFSVDAGQHFISKVLDLECPKIAHNGKFDVLYLETTTGIPTRNFVYDTLLGFYLLDEDPRNRRNLKHLAREFTSLPVLEYPEGEDLKTFPAEKLLKYNASDSRVTLALFEIVERELKKGKLIPLWKLITKASISLGRMELAGVKIDTEKLQELRTEAEDKERQLREALMKTAKNKGFPDLNLKSPVSLRSFLFDVLKLKPIGTTKKGAPSTEEKFLKNLKHPFVKGLLAWRKQVKLLDTYFQNIDSSIDSDGRVHPDYRLWATRSGRTSCSNPNVQNIPREGEIRSIFIPEEGNWFLECDYAQFELRVMAIYSEDENLKAAFLSGRDPHREIASFLYGKPLKEITDEERNKAKQMNFAILYGMGGASLAEELEIPKEEAEDLIKRYYSRFSKVQEWIENQKRIANREKEVLNWFHRKRHFPELNETKIQPMVYNEIMKQAVNSPIQSAASDLAMLGVNRITEKLKDYKSKPVMFIHDSVVLECPKSELKQVIELLKTEMVYFAKNFSIPFEVEIKIGLDWGNMEKI